MALVSRLFLTGFASTALFGPVVGRAVDTYGRKKGTLAFSVLYAMGALSTKSPLLGVLLFVTVRLVASQLQQPQPGYPY